MGWPLTGNNLSRFNRLLDDLRQYGDFPLVGSPDDITWLWQTIREASDNQLNPALDDAANRSHYWMLRLVAFLGDQIVPPTPPELSGIHLGPNETTIDNSNFDLDLYYITLDDPAITSVSFDSLETITGGNGFRGDSNSFVTSFSAPKLVSADVNGINFSGTGIYTRLNFPSLVSVTGDMDLYSNPVDFIDFTSLQSVGGGFDVVDDWPIVSVSFPSLKSIGLIATGVSAYAAYSCPNLTTLLYPALEQVDSDLVIFDCPLLSSIDFPSLVSANLNFSACDSVTSISVPSWADSTATFSDFSFQSFLSLTSVDFSSAEVVGSGAIDSCPVLTMLSMPVLTTISNLLLVSNNGLLATLEFPALVTVTNEIIIDNNDALVSVGLPVLSTGSILISNALALTSLEIASSLNGDIRLLSNSFVSFSLSSLVSLTGGIEFSDNTLLTSVNLASVSSLGSLTHGVHLNYGLAFDGNTSLVILSVPSLVTSGPLRIANCPSLTTVNFPLYVPQNGDSVFFFSNALTAASVNHILARCVANAGYVSGTVDVSGGTNAAPSGQGIADKATLIGRGCTVFTN